VWRFEILNKGNALAPLYISVFVAVLGFSLVAPIFPIYVVDLGASYTLLGIIVSIYGAVQLVTQIPIGRLSDRIGRKGLIILGLITFTVMPPLYIYATSAYLLIPIRMLGGVGASAVWPLAMALIIEQADAQGRGAAMGWYNASFYSALAFGPLIGGVLYDLFGLEAPFFFWSLLGLASILIVSIKVKEPERREVLSETAIAGIKEGLILPGYMTTFLACCGVVLWMGIVGGFNFTMLPSYASGLGLSTIEVGLLYLVYGGTMALSNIYFGKQADRGRRKRLIVLSCLLGTVSFGLLIFAQSLLQAVLLLAALGTSLGIGNPAAAALIADTTCPSRRGEIFGIFNTARMTGVVIGPLIAGLTADMYGVDGAIVAFTAIAVMITANALLVRDPTTESDICSQV
jgi:DHA1 family multidrug resistance protein-like MFS transporter